MLPSRFIFDDWFDEPKMDGRMKCDIYEKDGNTIVEASVPGFKKDEIKIECEDGTLTIQAEKNYDNKENDDKKYIRREIHRHEKCSRSFYLGDIDEENIKASFNDGVLTVTLPMKKIESSKKYIDIE